MCNSSLIRLGTLLLAAALLSSCALPEGSLLTMLKAGTFKKSAPLKTGVRYEVRKALDTGVAFSPSKIKGYSFVLNTSKPPLKLAARPTGGSELTVRTTAYCHDESDHIVYGVKNAVGTNLKYGSVRSAAADWSRYPVGTRFCIASEPGIVYEVDDYGSALVGTGTIDLYKPSQAMMNKWGVRHVDIKVLKWGSYERSMQLMRDRTRWPHVREMIRGIQTRMGLAGVPYESLPLTASL